MIGILSTPDERKGLFRDAEVMEWALQSGSAPVEVGVFMAPFTYGTKADEFVAKRWRATDRFKQLASDGWRFTDFVDASDVVVLFETLAVELIEYVLKKNKRVVYVPNLDWATVGGMDGTNAWVRHLRRLQDTFPKTFQVWSRQHSIWRELRDRWKVTSELVSWSIPDRIISSAGQRFNGGEVQLFCNAGNGGYENRRGVDLLLRAFAVARRREPRLRLTIKSIKPLVEYVSDHMHLLDEVDVIEGFASRQEVEETLQESDAVVHVSRWEGFGYPALEALHAGRPVIATDGWPVGDLVVHGHNGLLVKARHGGQMHLTPKWGVDVASLADAMVQLADDGLRFRLSAPCPMELVARRNHFVKRVRELVLDEPRPRVLLLGSGRTRSLPSERYWATALEAFGWIVGYWPHTEAGPVWPSGSGPTFVLAGKASIERLRAVKARWRTVPVVVWHHDHPDVLRPWEKEAKAIADIFFAPYAGAGVTTLLPGPRVSGGHLRAAGERRPVTDALQGPKRDVVFIGGQCERRRELVAYLTKHVPIWCFGPGMAKRPVYDEEADRVYRGAQVALSISQYSNTPWYTSNRLFHATAVGGAAVVSMAFPNCQKLFPEDAVEFAVDQRDLVAKTKALLADPRRRKRQSALAEAWCWRNHSWLNRIDVLLGKVASESGAFVHSPTVVPQESLERVMAEQLKSSSYSGPTKINIGCGKRLHQGYENLDARPLPGVRQVDVAKGLPYPDEVLDEVLAEDVLEHFPRNVLIKQVLPEIARCLKQGGVLVVQMPDLDELVRQWQGKEIDDDTMSMRLHGRQDYPENLHYASYTQASMTRHLNELGFGVVVRTATKNWNMVLHAVKGSAPTVHSPAPGAVTAASGTGGDWQSYWEERAQKLGMRSVTPMGWSPERQRIESDKLWQLLGAPWKDLPRGERVLDFGCGTGRWALRLQQMGDEVVGADFSKHMLRMAEACGLKHIQLLVEGEPLPFEDASFDALLTSTVLQHVPDEKIRAVVTELRRVLKPAAFVQLFENIDEGHGRTSSSGHVVFRRAEEYLDMFPGLRYQCGYVVENEQHAIMWGNFEG